MKSGSHVPRSVTNSSPENGVNQLFGSRLKSHSLSKRQKISKTRCHLAEAAPHPVSSPPRSQKRKEAESKRGRKGVEQSVFGPCSQKRRCAGWWQRPRWIGNPRVERIKRHLPHMGPWTPPILSLVPQRPGSNSIDRAARMV